ncbi:MAG: hypothetical protein INQ03_00400 [Candidatus Heimdallarchaeota archaeon]|nr:hypothetical protein [Candidatus Heimdallarchaeota archaeon]
MAEMLSNDILTKQEDGSYRLEYKLYKEYQSYLKNHDGNSQTIDKTEPKHNRGNNKQPTQILDWYKKWCDLKLGYFDKSSYISDSNVGDLINFMTDKAENNITYVVPYVEKIKPIEKFFAKNCERVLICRAPSEKSIVGKDMHNFFQNQINENVDVIYNSKIHAKIYLFDYKVAVIGSINMTGSSFSGKSTEAAIATFDEKIIMKTIEDLSSFMKKESND